MRHVFIINPAAGKSDQTATLCKEAEGVFSARGEKFEVCATNGVGHATELARKAAQTGLETVLYVCGGDGTLGEAAQGLAGSESCALAPVPVGSGNDFVKFFGEGAGRHFRSLSELAEGESRAIDLLQVGDRVCLNIASAGFDAAVCSRMPVYKKLPLVSGPVAYWLALLEGFFMSTRSRYSFVVDGALVPEGDYLFAVAANGRFYGGGFCAAPLAELSDGLIDLIRIPAIKRTQMLGMISRYRRGEHLEAYDFIEFTRCRSVQYRANEPILMNVDGEILSLRNPTVTVRRNALKLVVPRALADGSA